MRATSKILSVFLLSFFLAACQAAQTEKPAGQNPPETISPTTVSYNFGIPKRSAHHETNTPNHGAILAGVPVNVVIDFNFDLAKPSTISVKNNGVEYSEGETMIDSNKLAMRKVVKEIAPDGLYMVTYKACWPDGSCHDGNFQFVIDRKTMGSFIDMTGKKEVRVNLSNFAFVPQKIRISRGTKVTWTNNDQVGHYINTDSHPAHTYYPAQNSKLLPKGDSFSLVFEKPGIYPYHCSAHTTMTAAILVE